MREFEVRFATKRDLPAISGFGAPIVKAMKFYNKEHMARNVYELGVRDLKDTFRHKNCIIIAATKEGKIVGFCTHYPGHGHVDWLDWILVDKNLRKAGIGRALIGFVIKDAKRRGCHKIWCDSNPNNRLAFKFFTKMGFRKIGIAKRHAYREDEIFWEKQIK
ncbi:MAG: GNAT family N-acetyltransferase [Candidatus Micrarchaeota archaeon]|nr:GNAT family N-acetyltransferase [Candidatus Micrarchaeota archaeon]